MDSPTPTKTTLPQVPAILVPSSPPRSPGLPSSPPSSPGLPVASIPSPTTALTPKRTITSNRQPHHLDLDQSYHHNPEPDKPAMTRIPRALSRIQPHNTAGVKELLTPRRPSRHNRTESDTDT